MSNKKFLILFAVYVIYALVILLLAFADVISDHLWFILWIIPTATFFIMQLLDSKYQFKILN